MNRLLKNIHGFGLIEITIIIITIGILAAIAMQSMTALMTDARKVKTEREMELLSDAIVGDPEIVTNAHRSDFGYVGDVGSFPPNLDALISNPGGYATWDGPYISKEFAQDSDGFKTDEWGTAYSYSGGIQLTSTGSGSSITKKIADASNDYLLNSFNGTVLDASGSIPSITYLDSININITIPNGTGGLSTKSYMTDSSGTFTLDSLPVGSHPLRIIYTPNVDTLYSILTILPRHKTSRVYKFASSYFTSSGGSGGGSSGGIEYVNGTAQTTTDDCDRISFDVTNTSGNSITITSITPEWSSPTAYFNQVRYNNGVVYNQTPYVPSGTQIIFNSSKTLSAGSTVTIQIRGFSEDSDGDDEQSMSETDFTVTFSDGSEITFNSGYCDDD